MKPRVVIAGGTGFIGSYLRGSFEDDGYEVLVISRGNEFINWNDEAGITSALESAAALINLAGKSVDCRYIEKNKALIFSSRTETTRRLQSLLEKCNVPPPVWINSSTATIYRHAEDRPMDEFTGEIGSGFSVEVAKAWEKAFFENSAPRTRKVALRIAITLGKGGGVMKPFTNLVKFGIGGRQGSGRQMFSWIHIEDLYRVMRFAMDNEKIKGVYNASAPNPITNTHFMRSLRKILRPVIHLPSPSLLLKIGAFFIKTETELILKSRWVVPKKLIEEGFKFRYERVEDAVREILA